MDAVPILEIASGSVACVDDIAALQAAHDNIVGAIIGMAV